MWGISVPAIIDDNENKIVSSYVLKLDNFSLDPSIWHLDCPLCFFNSPKASAMTELNEDEQNKDTSFVYLWIGSNIGSAIVYKGKRLVGDHFREGEIAHLPIVPDGKPHFCGKKGCFGAYCELGELAKYANYRIEDFFVELRYGTEEFKRVWDEYLLHLAMGINAIRTLFDLDIVLGGDLASYIEDDLTKLKQNLKNLSRFSENGEYLRLASVKKYGASIGAAQQMNTLFLKKCGVLNEEDVH